MKTLYILIDESGNFDFTEKGTKHFVVSGYVTTAPSDVIVEIYSLKYLLLSLGYEQECFHATEDKQYVRDDVYKIISKSNGNYSFAFVEKVKLPQKLQNKTDMYSLCIKTLIIQTVQKEQNKGSMYSNIVIIMDKVLTHQEKSCFYKIIRPELKKFKLEYQIYFFQTKSDCNAQIADYGSWARYVALERNEQRPLREINHMIKVDINISNTHI